MGSDFFTEPGSEFQLFLFKTNTMAIIAAPRTPVRQPQNSIWVLAAVEALEEAGTAGFDGAAGSELFDGVGAGSGSGFGSGDGSGSFSS